MHLRSRYSVDPLTRRTIVLFQRLRKWQLRNNLPELLIGEWNVPNMLDRTVTDDTLPYNRLFEAAHRLADQYKWHVTAWDIENKGLTAAYHLNIYYHGDDTSDTANTLGTQAATVERHPTPKVGAAFTPPYYRGINFAGADWVGASFTTYSNSNPGEITDGDASSGGAFYNHPKNANLDWIAARGHKIMRYPFKWERLQTSLGGALRTTAVGGSPRSEVAAITNTLDRCATNGVKVILDCHNYGMYTTSGGDQLMGGGTLTTTHFGDLWSRIVTQWGSHSAVWGYGLMNEPHGLASNATWESYAQAAVTAIRNQETSLSQTNKRIFVAAHPWSSAETWPTSHPTWFITDSANLSIPEAHHYFEITNVGTFPRHYQVENKTGTAANTGVTGFVSAYDSGYRA